MTADRLITRPYGALELKQTYQQGLLWGLLAAAMLHVGALWALTVYGGLSSGPPLVNRVPHKSDEGTLRMSRPVQLEELPLPGAKPPGGMAQRVDHGTILLVSDTVLFEEVLIPTQDDVRGGITPGADPGGSKLGDSSALSGEPDWVPHIPEFGEFVFVTRDPKPLPNQLPPVYTDLARLMEAEGTVVLSLLISESGDVLDVKPLNREGSISPLLVEAAMKAVRTWKFIPALQQDRCVPVWFNQAFDFSLRQQ